MEYAIEMVTPDLKFPAEQFDQQHRRYEEMCGRIGQERAHQMIDAALRTLKLVQAV